MCALLFSKKLLFTIKFNISIMRSLELAFIYKWNASCFIRIERNVSSCIRGQNLTFELNLSTMLVRINLSIFYSRTFQFFIFLIYSLVSHIDTSFKISSITDLNSFFVEFKVNYSSFYRRSKIGLKPTFYFIYVKAYSWIIWVM